MGFKNSRIVGIPPILLIVLSLNFVRPTDQEFKKLPLLMPDVQPMQKETYLCTAYKMPRSDYEYIVEFEPNATMHTAHHILIYGCTLPGRWERDSPRLVWDCGEMVGVHRGFISGPTCSSGSQIIYAWAKDAPPLKLPEGVGFKVGLGSGINYLVLQVHYAHVDQFLNGATDNSGIILTLLPSSTDKVSKNAGVYLLGTGGMIPPRQIEYMETACTIQEPLELHPFAYRTHTHALGKVVTGYKIDKEGTWHLVGKHNPQEPQMFYPVENKNLTINKGDILAARCTMYNFRDRVTFIGPTGEDEMCNFYMMYYTEGTETLAERNCFTGGPPTYYWKKDIRIGYVPSSIDIDASTLNK